MPLFQNEIKNENLSYENEFCMQFHFHANQSHFHKNGFALRLALRQKHKGTRKWPIRITRITLKFIHNALLVYKRGLCFRNFQIFRDFPTCENWLPNTRSIFFPRSFSCLRTESADFWSLKGKVINTGLSTGLIQLWFWAPWIGCQRNPSQWNSRFRLQAKKSSRLAHLYGLLTEVP